MALGFRKSFFGYNCEEVAEYISKTAAENKETVLSLRKKIDEEAENNAAAKAEIEQLSSKLSDINESLEFYKTKYEEIKNLSDNIGKLYLVAQTNAKAIISAADSAQNSSKEEIDKNIAVLDAAGDSLQTIKEKINSLNSDFSAKVNELFLELENVKRLASNAEQAKKDGVENFERAFKSITE